MQTCPTVSRALPRYSTTSFPALVHRFLEHMSRILLMTEAADCARLSNIGPSSFTIRITDKEEHWSCCPKLGTLSYLLSLRSTY